MIISLIHPSRGRPTKSYKNTIEWLDRSGIENIEVIVSVDKNDPHLNGYEMAYHFFHKDCYEADNFKLICGKNDSVVEATNRAARQSTGDILIYLSDDFSAPYNWGRLVLKEFEGLTEPMLLKVDDCLQRFDAPVLTIPIMNRALYEKLGYFWYPEYKSMFVDEDLYWTAKKLGALKLAPHLKFPHEHVSVGKAQDDETYRRSAANWDQGKALFAKRKTAGFPL